jgi:hypothetical protein
VAIAVGVTSKGRTGSASSQATTGVTTQTSGSAFVVAAAWDSARNFTSIADNKGNSANYVQIGNQVTFSGGGGRARLYYCQNGAGGAGHTATITVSGSAGITVLFLELTGGATSGILDQNSTGVNDTSSPFTSQSITTTQAAEALISSLFGNSGANPATHAESTGFTVQAGADETNGSSFWTGCLASRIVAATGTYNSSFTESSGSNTAVHIASFKEAGASAATKRNNLMLLGMNR